MVGFLSAKPFMDPAKSPSVFGANTLRLPESQFETVGSDSRVSRIEKVFDHFNCPLAGTGAFIVAQADAYGIPYWLVPAVSFQESGCGKKTPNVAGLEESYNAWGYGVWGSNVKTFTGWEAGISAVAKYFGTNFFAKGITDPCAIMAVYTPPSNGSWCEGVNYFADLIQNFESE